MKRFGPSQAQLRRMKFSVATAAAGSERKALLSHSKAYFGGGSYSDTPIFDGAKLQNGMSVQGPSIVILPDTTIVVPPFASLSTADHGYFVMRVDAAADQVEPLREAS